MTGGVWVGVAALGGAGAVLRFVVDAMVSSLSGRRFPYGTLVVNLSGAVVLGLLSGLVDGDAYLLLGTAAVGSYTTFSTWMYETHRLVEDGELSLAVTNVLASLALGIGAAAIGAQL